MSKKTKKPFQMDIKQSNAGRPLIYKKDFHPKDLLELSSQGKNVAQICSIWDISKETFYSWAKDKNKKEFSDAYKKSKSNLERWYIDFGHKMMDGTLKDGNATIYVWLTKNCLGWAERNEHHITADDFEFDYEEDGEEVA